MRCRLILPAPADADDDWTSQLLPFQQEIVHDQRKTLVANWGVGTGKTLTGACWLILGMLANPRMWAMHISPTFTLFWENVYPKLDEMDELWNQVNGFPLIIKWHKSTQNLWLQLFNGTRCFIKSGENPDRIRGQTVGLIWIDELASNRDAERVYHNALARLRGRGPRQVLITSTPQGDQGPIGELHAKWREQDPNVLFSTHSSYDNKFQPKDYLENLKSVYSKEYYEQEVEAKLLAVQGRMYPEFTRPTHLIDWDLHNLHTHMWQIVVGVDWGTGWSHAVFCAIQGVHDPQIVVFDEIALDNQSDETLIQEILKRCNQHRIIPRAFCPDPTGEDAIRELRRVVGKTGYGSRVVMEKDPNRRKLSRSCELVRRLLQTADGKIRMRFARSLETNGHNTLGQKQRGVLMGLEGLRRKKGPGGIFTNAPFDDSFLIHGCDALRYVCLNLPRLGYTLDARIEEALMVRGLPVEDGT
jgi:phage terminase large subunit-like protein